MTLPTVGTRETRTIALTRDAVDTNKRTIALAFSSETPVLRSWGWEILDHNPGALNLGRLNAGGALLINHDTDKQVGVVERAYLGADRKGRATVRFGKSDFANEIFNDVQDGIRSLVSFGYEINEVVADGEKDGTPVYRVTRFTPTEISIVAVPADTAVGVGRSLEDDETEEESNAVADLLADIIISIADKSEDEADGEDEATEDRGSDDGEDDEADDEIDSEQERSEKATPLARAIPATSIRAVSTPSPKANQKVSTEINETLAAERDRVKTINAMASRLDCAELATRAIDEGMAVADFVKLYNDKTPETRAIKTAEAPTIGLTDKEVRSYSFVNAIRAQMDPSNAAFQKAAAFERDVSNAATAKLGTSGTGGFMLPYDVLTGSRTLTVGSAPQGGNTVATELHSDLFIDMFRNKLAVAKLGATMIGGLNGNFSIPRQNGAATTYWIAEAAAPTTSNQSFDQVAMTPKTVGAFTDYSRLLLLQSSVDIESVVRNDIAAQLAIAVDLAATSGSGTGGQPLGILGTTGVGSVVGGTNGAQPSFATHIVALETAVAAANADVDKMAYLTNAKARGFLKSLPRLGKTSGMPTWDLDGTMNGYSTAVSNSITSTGTKGTSTGVCSTILFGNFADLIVAMWAGIEIKVDPYANSTTGSVRVIGLQSVDIGVRHAASFAAMTDALCG